MCLKHFEINIKGYAFTVAVMLSPIFCDIAFSIFRIPNKNNQLLRRPQDPNLLLQNCFLGLRDSLYLYVSSTTFWYLFTLNVTYNVINFFLFNYTLKLQYGVYIYK